MDGGRLPTNIEKRVQSLENTKALILALCLIFGVSGAWGYHLLLNARTQLKDLADPTDKFSLAKEKALADFKGKATQEKEAQIAAFKAEAHSFTIDWDPPTTPATLVGGMPNPAPQSLGTHDICMIVNNDFHIVTNAESSCSLSVDKHDWKLSMRHDALVNNNGSSTACAVICGKIK
jgi:hypothetical protein